MDGLCDVKGCTGPTYMGWRPLTESRGRQICEHHWLRHKDPQDSFDLFIAFGFRRPAGIRKPMPRKDIPRYSPEPERTDYKQPIVKSEPSQEKSKPQTIPTIEKPSGCRACGADREAGHTYCKSCAAERKKHSDRERQKRRYHKMQKPHAFAPEIKRPVCDSLQEYFS